MFRDLGNLVVEQGTVLDSVEYNVSTTARELEGAVEELKVAQKYVNPTNLRKGRLLMVDINLMRAEENASFSSFFSLLVW